MVASIWRENRPPNSETSEPTTYPKGTCPEPPSRETAHILFGLPGITSIYHIIFVLPKCYLAPPTQCPGLRRTDAGRELPGWLSFWSCYDGEIGSSIDHSSTRSPTNFLRTRHRCRRTSEALEFEVAWTHAKLILFLNISW